MGCCANDDDDDDDDTNLKVHKYPPSEQPSFCMRKGFTDRHVAANIRFLSLVNSAPKLKPSQTILVGF